MNFNYLTTTLKYISVAFVWSMTDIFIDNCYHFHIRLNVHLIDDLSAKMIIVIVGVVRSRRFALVVTRVYICTAKQVFEAKCKNNHLHPIVAIIYKFSLLYL